MAAKGPTIQEHRDACQCCCKNAHSVCPRSLSGNVVPHQALGELLA